jgi:hypothetical protein
MAGKTKRFKEKASPPLYPFTFYFLLFTFYFLLFTFYFSPSPSSFLRLRHHKNPIRPTMR